MECLLGSRSRRTPCAAAVLSRSRTPPSSPAEPPRRRAGRSARRSPTTSRSSSTARSKQPVLGFGADGARAADAGDLPARQQRHAVRDDLRLARSRRTTSRSTSTTAATRPASCGGSATKAISATCRPRPTNRSSARRTRRSANVPDVRAFVRGGAPLHRCDAGRHRRPLRSAPPSRASGCGRTALTPRCGRSSPSTGRTTGSSTARPSRGTTTRRRPRAGSTPYSAVCREYGCRRTPLLATLNAGDETPGPTGVRSRCVNADTSFVYFDRQDGAFAPVPPEDREGRPHDFSRSASARGRGERRPRRAGQLRRVARLGASRHRQLARELGHHVRRVDRPAARPRRRSGRRRRPPCLHASASRRASPRRSCGRDRAGT